MPRLTNNQPKLRIVIFKTKNNQEPFSDWIKSLPKETRFRIYQRFSRIEEGNFGDFKNLRNGLYELRFHFDSGIRVYYTKKGNEMVILFCGGNKKSQEKNINLAKKYLEQITED